MHLELWHGTNQSFAQFDEKMLGLNTSNPASRQAFFFAKDPETARDYAAQASRNLIPDQQTHEARVDALLQKANDALSEDDFNLYEALILEAEELETNALQADPAGARILKCRIHLENPIEIDGSAHAVAMDLGGYLQEAIKAGHDAVILHDIMDTPSGGGEPDMHVAVFDASQIEIIEVIELEPEVEPEESEFPEFA